METTQWDALTQNRRNSRKVRDEELRPFRVVKAQRLQYLVVKERRQLCLVVKEPHRVYPVEKARRPRVRVVRVLLAFLEVRVAKVLLPSPAVKVLPFQEAKARPFQEAKVQPLKVEKVRPFQAAKDDRQFLVVWRSRRVPLARTTWISKPRLFTPSRQPIPYSLDPSAAACSSTAFPPSRAHLRIPCGPLSRQRLGSTRRMAFRCSVRTR